MIYKQASKLKLRFQTGSGSLSVEQLWELSLSQLAQAIKSVNTIIKKDNEGHEDLSFLDETRVVDTTNQLRFDILKDIYTEKKKESDKQRQDLLDKQNNQMILDIISEKENKSLKEMSIDDLKKLLR